MGTCPNLFLLHSIHSGNKYYYIDQLRRDYAPGVKELFYHYFQGMAVSLGHKHQMNIFRSKHARYTVQKNCERRSHKA